MSSVAAECFLTFLLGNNSEGTHKVLHNVKIVEIFRLTWSHSGMYLQQNAATFSSKRELYSLFVQFRTFWNFYLMKFCGNCAENALKTINLKDFSTISGPICCFFRSPNKSLRKQRTNLSIFFSFNNIIYEIYRKFYKKLIKLVKMESFKKLVLFL